MTARRVLALLCAVGGLAATGCGGDGAGAPVVQAAGAIEQRQEHGRTTITVGSKNFTESRILAELYGQALRAAGYDARVRLDVGDERVSLAALREGSIDAYPEYTATALTAFFGVPLASVPRPVGEAHAQAAAEYRAIGIEALAPAPLNDTQALGMRTVDARRLGARTISDLRRHAPRLTLTGAPECRRRADCLLGVQRAYRLRFGRFVGVAAERRYPALQSGDADVAVMYTTDGELARGGYTVLRDDRGFFPPYHPTLTVRGTVARRAGDELRDVVGLVQRDLTTPVMQSLNAGVDIDGRSPRQMAAEHLEAYGLVDPRSGR